MGESIFNKILEKCPWLVRWVFYVFWIGAVVMSWLFIQGWQAKTRTDSYMSAIASDVFDRKIAPINSERHSRFSHVSSRLDSVDNEMKEQGRTLYRLEGKIDALLDK